MDWVFAEKDQAIAELDRKLQDQSQELKTRAGQVAGMDQAELDFEQVKPLEMDQAEPWAVLNPGVRGFFSQ